MERKILITKANFCIVDFETTGINYKSDKIIEIGAVRANQFEITDKFHKIVDPLKKIPSRITEVTGITNDMIQGMPTIDDVKNDFFKFLDDNIWVEHSNNWFDFNFAKQEFSMNKNVFRINTMKLSKIVYNFDKVNLDIVVKKLIPNTQKPREKHKALEDAILTTLILQEILKCLNDRGINYLILYNEKEVL